MPWLLPIDDMMPQPLHRGKGWAGTVAGVRAVREARECARAADRLHSESLREKAWGAHLAAACQKRALAAEIGEELERLDPEELSKTRWESEPYVAGHVMLDALIRLRAPLAPSVLASITRGFPTEGTILMLQYAPENRALLAAIRVANVDGAAWVAASNALAHLRAPGFAATLLQEIPLANWVWVSDCGDSPRPGVGGSLIGGLLTLKVPPDFPPVILYRLSSQRTPGDELVSDGATPIYSQRTRIEPGTDDALDWPIEGYSIHYKRIGYLAELARVSMPEVQRAVDTDTAVRWTDIPHLREEVSRSLARQEAALKRLASALISAGVLETAELGTPRHIEVKVNDQRSQRTEPLPRIPPFDIRLP